MKKRIQRDLRCSLSQERGRNPIYMTKCALWNNHETSVLQNRVSKLWMFFWEKIILCLTGDYPGITFCSGFCLEFESKRVRKCVRGHVWVWVCKYCGFPIMGRWEQWSDFNLSFTFSELVAVLYVSNSKDRNQPRVALLKTNGSKIQWEM